MYKSLDCQPTHSRKPTSLIIGSLKICVLTWVTCPLVVTSSSVHHPENSLALESTVKNRLQGFISWLLPQYKSGCLLYLVIVFSISIAGYQFWRILKVSRSETMVRKALEAPSPAKVGLLLQDLQPVEEKERDIEGYPGLYETIGPRDNEDRHEGKNVQKLERMRSSPSLNPLAKSTASHRPKPRHLRHISTPPSPVRSTPMSLAEAVAAETFNFGDNPDYFVATEDLVTSSPYKRGPNKVTADSRPSSPFRPPIRPGHNRLYRSASFQHHPYRQISRPSPGQFVSTCQFPLPTLRPEGSEPASPTARSFPHSPQHMYSVPPSPTARSFPHSPQHMYSMPPSPTAALNSYCFTSVVPEGTTTPSTPGREGSEQEMFMRYWRHYPRDTPGPKHARTQSLPIQSFLPAPPFSNALTSQPSKLDSESDSRKEASQADETSHEAFSDTNSGDAEGRKGEEKPVMIFEQGQSVVTGERWKWRRKVTVFRSDLLEKLEKEGLVRC